MHRFIELFLALRYLRPTRSFVSVITLLSLSGVTVGVAVLILVLSVMKGFERELRDKVIGFNSHLTVTNHGILRDWEAVAEQLLQQPGIEAVSPFMTGPVLVRVNNQIATPFIRGIDPATIDGVIPVRQAILGGALDLTPDSVIVGSEWAARHRARVGDPIVVISPRTITALLDEPGAAREQYLPSQYTIAGVFTTGYYEYDANTLLMSLAEGQRLYNLAGGVHGLLARTTDPFRAFELKERLNAQLAPPLMALTWMDLNARLFGAIVVERRMMAFILLFIIIVAALGLCGTLVTVTVQKAREIGLMKALGAGDAQIVSVFTLYGLVIGVAGSAAGVVAGCGILRYRNEFSQWLSRTFHLEVFPPEIYHFAQIPAVTDGWMVAWIALSGVLLSTAAALLPACAALRVEPAAVLHGE